MKLTTTFSVPLPLEEAWTVLQDIERVATWFPGARLDSVEEESFKGTVRVKLGPMMVDYRGTARFVERDEALRRVVIEASGREQRGSGTARALAVTDLTAAGGGTGVSVSIDLDVTGRPAQLGQSLMQDITQRLVAEFSSRMEADLSAPATETAPGTGTATGTGSTPGDNTEPSDPADAAASRGPRARTTDRANEAPDDVLDLGRIAGPAMMRKFAPAIGALVVLVFLWRRLSRGPNR